MISKTCINCSNCDRIAAGYWYCKIFKDKVYTNTSCDGRFHPYEKDSKDKRLMSEEEIQSLL